MNVRSYFTLALNLSLLLAMSLWLVAGCRPEASRETASQSGSQAVDPKVSEASFVKAQNIMTASCMPCHNHQNLPLVIDKLRKAKFKAIGSDTRERLIAELEELEGFMKEGMSLSFSGKKDIDRFFGATAGDFYVVLERGVMPPPWAPELMREIDWQGYQPITPENRVELLKYAKPFMGQYVR